MINRQFSYRLLDEIIDIFKGNNENDSSENYMEKISKTFPLATQYAIDVRNNKMKWEKIVKYLTETDAIHRPEDILPINELTQNGEMNFRQLVAALLGDSSDRVEAKKYIRQDIKLMSPLFFYEHLTHCEA